jgi:hypothetical protein
LVQAILGKSAIIDEGSLEMDQKRRVHGKTRKSSTDKEGKSKDGIRMHIDEENNWTLDQSCLGS